MHKKAIIAKKLKKELVVTVGFFMLFPNEVVQSNYGDVLTMLSH